MTENNASAGIRGITENIKAGIRGYNSKSAGNKYILAAAAAIVIALLCEIFVFNYKTFNSLFDSPLSCSLSFSGAQLSGNNIRFTSDNAEIRFKDVDSEVKYLRFSPSAGKEVKITVSAADEANANFISAPERTVHGDVKRTQYIRMNFSGKVSDLKVKISGMSGETISRDDIGLNERVPLCFSWGRFLLFAAGLMLLYILRPRSELYKYTTNLTNKKQRLIALLLIAVQAVFMWNMIHWNKTFLERIPNDASKSYDELIDAFKDGHLYLNIEPSEELEEMENPYDTGARSGKSYRFDHAYYNGKYYVYYGALPAVLMYLPYNLMTGGELPHHIALYILSVFIMFGIMLLLWEIIKKWFKRTPFLVFAELSVVFGAISGFAYAIFKPDFYFVSYMMAIALGIFGLALWISAECQIETADKNGKITLSSGFSSSRLAWGSLCIALIAGCRPQLLIALAAGVVLFWNAVFKDRKLFSRSGIKPTAAICIPLVAVAIVVMWYNAARFSSPFDFGANYNLTTNDMTHRGMKAGRVGLSLFTYLFQPIRMDAVFPFIHEFDVTNVYQGFTLSQVMDGGIFMLFPILLFGIFGVIAKRMFKSKLPYTLICVLLLSTAALAMFDAQGAGYLTRYYMDFVWLAMTAACMTIFACRDNYEGNTRAVRIVYGITLAMSALTMFMTFLWIFTNDDLMTPIRGSDPALYYTIQSLVAFWM